jgi:hypothetical protein
MTDKELYNPDEFLLDNIKEYHYEVMDEGTSCVDGILF